MVKEEVSSWTNEQWLEALDGGPAHEMAVTALRALLLRGLRFSLANKLNADFDAITEDFAQEAVLKVIDKRDTFRGESKFTTWAQKVAVRVALSELRRQRWRDLSLEQLTERADGSTFIPLELADEAPSPEEKTSRRGMVAAVGRIITERLTPRQNQALTELMVYGLPVDQVADNMDTNRNALYKLVHDARLRLKRALADEGLSAEEILNAFD